MSELRAMVANEAPTAMSPAAALLIAVARATASPSEAEDRYRPAVEAMQDSDWRAFLRLAPDHGMFPLATRALAHQPGLPPAVATDLANAEQANARRALALAGELVAILADLESAGLRAIPWKGPLLAQRAYGDINRRYYFDLDVLVRRSDFAAARDHLMQLGFAPEKRMTIAQQRTYVAHQGELELVRESDQLWFELHTAVVPNYHASVRSDDGPWRRAKPYRLAGRDVLGLDPLDEMESLCVHGSKHRWERLIWIVDVALVARLIAAGDWPLLFARATKHGTRRMVQLGLLLAMDLVGAQLPADASAMARSDHVARTLARQAAAGLFWPGDRRPDALLFHARMRERPVDRLRYLVSAGFTPSAADWEAVRLPDALFPLYTLTRPARLALKYGRRALRGGERSAVATRAPGQETFRSGEPPD